MVENTDGAPSVPRRIGRYEIVGKVATGGMAEILLARLVGPSGFERPVVIKRILPHLASEPGFIEMFLDEARIVARLRHANVVHVYELSAEGSELFMVMEYLEGESVSGIIRRLWGHQNLMDPEIAAVIAAGACAGLHAAHELADQDGKNLGLVHRDVSPQNIFVTYQGEVKVLDFGIAKSADRQGKTEAGVLKGKSSYMSPEQCRAKPLDRRSDVFAMGTVLFEMCTTRRLFYRDNPLLTFRAICEQPIPAISKHRSDIPAALDAIGRRALARVPSDRYPSAYEMRRDLLAAARALTSCEPEELLAHMMRELFPERIEERHKLREHIEQGSRVTRLPDPETDIGISIPNAAGQTPDTEEGPELSAPDPKRRRPFLLAAVGAIFLTALALLAIAIRQDIGSMKLAARGAPAAAQSALAPEAVPPLPASEQPSGTTAPSLTARFVAIGVATKPPGARILVAGQERGTTPARIELSQSTEVVSVVVTLDGHAEQRIEVRPDVDQRFDLTMEPIMLGNAPSAVGSATSVASAKPTAAPPLHSGHEPPRKTAPSATPLHSAPSSAFHRFD